jgi:hypothetical protein
MAVQLQTTQVVLSVAAPPLCAALYPQIEKALASTSRKCRAMAERFLTRTVTDLPKDQGRVATWVESGKLFGQRFEKDGRSMTSPFVIASKSESLNAKPQAVGTNNGVLIFVWRRANDLFARVFQLIENTADDEYRLNDSPLVKETPHSAFLLEGNRVQVLSQEQRENGTQVVGRTINVASDDLLMPYLGDVAPIRS